MLIPIRLPICNVFLLKGDRPILIDTGRPSDFAAIEYALLTHNVAPAELSLILHTHGHWDHCGSTAEFRRHTTAPVAIHAADAPMMRRGDNGILKPASTFGRLFRRFLDVRFPPLEPDFLIEDEIDLAAFGVSARVVFTPGHTAGSISVLTADGDAIVGDLLMGGYFGGRLRASRPGQHYFAEDAATVRSSIRKVLALAPRAIFPSHGGPLDPQGVARWLAVYNENAVKTQGRL